MNNKINKSDKNYKKGNLVVSTPIIILVSSFFVIVIGVYVINMIEPFIWYEKLNATAQKYMFVIEKYGYLTEDEKNNLIETLNSQGFNTENLEIIAPSNIRNYGELLEFKINYKLIQKTPFVSNKDINLKERCINMCIKKYSYSKI